MAVVRVQGLGTDKVWQARDTARHDDGDRRDDRKRDETVVEKRKAVLGLEEAMKQSDNGAVRTQELETEEVSSSISAEGYSNSALDLPKRVGCFRFPSPGKSEEDNAAQYRSTAKVQSERATNAFSRPWHSPDLPEESTGPRDGDILAKSWRL